LGSSRPEPGEGHPQWSPDGGRIAFESDASGDFEI
jgi:Tol biopolymer transport system component